jgi:DUF4097 and DUF4098 domain-containing protein YvlB
MSNEERARILRMVAEGKVTPAEAEDLLAALDAAPDAGARSTGPSATFGPGSMPAPPVPPGLPGIRKQRRSLVIQVKEGGDSKVNVRIPLSLARAAGKFIPRHAQQHLAAYNINLEEFLSGLSDAEGDGTLVEVKDGKDEVRIAVE